MNTFLRLENKTWVHHSGRTFLIDHTSASSAKGHKSKSAASNGLLESPMPGKVLKVNVKIGDSVKENETVCVIEAMKMEYALKSPFNGKIKSVFKTAGQQVGLTEKILEIEKI